MLRMLADENFNGDIVRGLLLRQPDFDMVRVQDVGLAGAEDPDVLAWAAENERILLTHDRATIPDYAFERLAVGEKMAGVFLLNDRFPVGQAIQEILLIAACSEQAEWSSRVVHLPL
jgi:predicted nuclease of predicted toxin-antitoxin system